MFKLYTFGHSLRIHSQTDTVTAQSWNCTPRIGGACLTPCHRNSCCSLIKEAGRSSAFKALDCHFSDSE